MRRDVIFLSVDELHCNSVAGAADQKTTTSPRRYCEIAIKHWTTDDWHSHNESKFATSFPIKRLVP